MRDYFQIEEGMYHRDCIEWVRVDGGPDGFGCWGEIKLKQEATPRRIGDGSYRMDPKHEQHDCAGWHFWRIKAIMRDALGENHTQRQHEALAESKEDKT